MKKQRKTKSDTKCGLCWNEKFFAENTEEDFGTLKNKVILEEFNLCKKHKEELEMKPKNDGKKEMVMEPVPCDEFLGAVISDIKYEEAHAFTGQFSRVGEAVRIQFTLDPYNGKAFEHPKYSRWMSFNYDQKSNLFKNFILPLVKGAKPYMDFDIMNLKGVKCRLMFEETQNDEGKKFYNIMMVKPEKGVQVDTLPTIQLEPDDEQTPF